MKQDRGTKTGSIAIATRSLLECLNLGVDGFEVRVRDAMDDGVDDPPQVTPDRLAGFHHRR